MLLVSIAFSLKRIKRLGVGHWHWIYWNSFFYFLEQFLLLEQFVIEIISFIEIISYFILTKTQKKPLAVFIISINKALLYGTSRGKKMAPLVEKDPTSRGKF